MWWDEGKRRVWEDKRERREAKREMEEKRRGGGRQIKYDQGTEVGGRVVRDAGYLNRKESSRKKRRRRTEIDRRIILDIWRAKYTE
jgi:hypothetical protein